MSEKEVDRAQILQQAQLGVITLKQASKLMNLSYPQTKRRWARFKKEGPKGLISKKRGQKSNRAVPIERLREIAEIIAENYKGCKPLFITEKLQERHNISYSSEFIRQLMIKYKLWYPKQSKIKIHRRRLRRECEGEMVQMDASDHDWFEGRGPRCHLHLIVDDATSALFGGYFTPEETTEGYYKACMSYFEKRGRPRSIYCDKRGTFKVNSGNKRGVTQFTRAMGELDIEMIFAHSPQAKGRVERSFSTLQERLIWEMRIRNISTIEEANNYLQHFIEEYNKKYSKEPASPFNAHRPLNQKMPLKYILCQKEERTVSKALEVHYQNTVYQLEVPQEFQGSIRRAKINVIKTLEGEIQFEYKGVLIDYKRYDELPYKKSKIDFQKLEQNWKKGRRKGRKASKNHPWKTNARAVA